jgi:hypothetical protein
MRNALLACLVALSLACLITGCPGGGGLLGGEPTAVITATPESGFVVGTAIELDASESIDPNSGKLTYAWLLVSKPGGSTAALSSTNNESITLTPDAAGTYKIRLSVITALKKTDSVEIDLVVAASPTVNASLSALSLTGGSISFSATTLTYSVSVPNGVTSTTITASPAETGTTIAIDGKAGSPQTVNLAIGSTSIPVVATASNGTTKKTYTLNITREAAQPSDAGLVSLSLTGAALVFAPGTTTYNVNVDNSVASTTVTATASQTGALITIGGVAGASRTVTLGVGANAISVLVTSPDASATKTYTINVTRAAPSTDATLTALSMTGATFTFAKATETYNVNVGNSIASTTVSATATESAAQITIGGVAGASKTVTLSVGANAIRIVVTAPDGTTKKTYTIYVNRATSSNATLSTLSMTGASFVFSATTFDYSVQVPNSVNETTVSATATDTGSVVSIAGQAATTATVDLDEGLNVIPIVIDASDGFSTGRYELRITRASQRIDYFVVYGWDSATSFFEDYREVYDYSSSATSRYSAQERVNAAPSTGRTRRVFSRDPLGRVVVCETYDVASTPATLKSTNSYVYDGDSWRKLQTNTYSPGSSITSQWRYSYDGEGRLTDNRYYRFISGEYALREHVTYHYGAEGGILAATYYSWWDDKTYNMNYAYDEKGNLTEVLYYADGVLVGKDLMSYNADSRMLTATYSWTNGTNIVPNEKDEYFYEDFYPGSTTEIPETGSLGVVRIR